FYYITATDERKNKNSTKKSPVIVKNTPPSIKLEVLPEGQRIFGEGDKPDFAFKQEGSKEDKWVAKIEDADGNVVRNYVWNDSAPKSFSWNGTDDKGIIVHDGVYKYSITATDRAGNTAPLTEVSNIIFSAEKPETNVFISGSKYFSTPEKSDISSVKLEVVIPEPRKGSGNALVHWSVDILNESDSVVKSYSGGKDDLPPTQIVFDGKNQSGAQIPDGEYYARVNAEYLNGYKAPVINSPKFTFDTQAPQASLLSYDEIFSPDGDGNKDVFTLKQSAAKKSGAPIRNWTARVVKAGSETPVYEWKFGSSLPESVSWSGLDSSGNLCSDGAYEYELFASDAAGNKFSAKTPKAFSLDTSKTEVMLAASDAAFNPIGKRKTVTYTSVLKSSAVKSYNFEIKNASKVVVFSLQGNGNVPGKFTWNGKSSAGILCDDGIYSASISIESVNGSTARADALPVQIDTKDPSVKITLSDKVFSPDGDSRKESLKAAAADSTVEDEWIASVINAKGETVKAFEWEGKVPANFEWDGSDDTGNKAPDGNYSLQVQAVDKAGNEFKQKFDGITMDSRPVNAYVTAALPGISPDSKTGLTEQKFALRLSLNEGIDSWSFEIVDAKGNSVYAFDNAAKTIPQAFVWNGKDKEQKNLEGTFVGRLKIEYTKGNLVDVKTSAFICSVTPPALTVSVAPEFFSPDNDGTDDDCFISLRGSAANGAKLVSWSFDINNPLGSGKAGAFWKTSGTDKITPQIVWDGLSNTSVEKNGKAERVQSAMDYPYVFTVTDNLGLTSVKTGVIPVDILVIPEGDVLKMAVPSIIFRSNHADFKTAEEAAGSQVTRAQAANNVRVLKRVAEVLKKFPDYTVTVVGHANKTGAAGEDETLLKLSNLRAAFVKDRLVEYGIKADRLSSEGKGGSQPVAEFSDTANWWKNRRVEFILHK
nr:OmpA family protein [Treponema sp.]